MVEDIIEIKTHTGTSIIFVPDPARNFKDTLIYIEKNGRVIFSDYVSTTEFIKTVGKININDET